MECAVIEPICDENDNGQNKTNAMPWIDDENGVTSKSKHM